MTRSTPLAIIVLLGPWQLLRTQALGLPPLRHEQQVVLEPNASHLGLADLHQDNATSLVATHRRGTATAQYTILSNGSMFVNTSEQNPFLDVVKDLLGGIGNVGNSVGNVADTVGGTSHTVDDVSTGVGGVADIVDSIWDIVHGRNPAEDDGPRNFLDSIQDVAGTVSDVADAVGQVSNGLGDTSQSLADLANKFRAELLRLSVPVAEGGNNRVHINRLACLIVGLIVASTVASYFLETYVPCMSPTEGRPRLWQLALLVGSYAILIPGIIEVLFSFTIAIEFMGLTLTVTSVDGQPSPITESMRSVVSELSRTGAHLGATLVVLYAMVIPVLKLVLLLIGELFRFSENPFRVSLARWCIRFVQMISKWACPDMFAYILLLYLVRALDHRSSLIAAPAHLDVGFSCFAIFCTCSTFTSLAIHLPKGPATGNPDFEGGGIPQARTGQDTDGRRTLLLWGTGVLYCLFAILFCTGLLLPCMSLKLDTSLLVQPHGPLPAIALPFIKLLRLDEQVNSEVTIWKCLVALCRWVYYGEANCILAIIMLAGFALLLPVFNMMTLMFVAEDIVSQGEKDGKENVFWRAVGNHGMKVSEVLKHLAMLDVAVMGVIVISLTGQSYKKEGIVFHMEYGLLFLFLAEVVHYVTFYLVRHAHSARQQELAGG